MIPEQLTEANEAILAEVNILVHQLSSSSPGCKLEWLQKIVSDSDYEAWVIRDSGKIIGMGVLVELTIPTGPYARIEEVVVDEAYRGKGLGKLVSEKLVERAKVRGNKFVDLNSRPSRVAANELYKKLGFKQRESNTYRLEF